MQKAAAITFMQDWIKNYLAAQTKATDSIDVAKVGTIVELLRTALKEDRQVFACGNGGSAANASHFATDLGKSSSDAVGKCFRVLSLNDNVSWLTAIGNDYSYEDTYVRQLQNYGRSGDVLITISVSGNSPNVVKALSWGREHGLKTVALVGGKRGRAADIADYVIVINDTHYGRVEDAQMHILHMICYAFVENPGIARA
jgi:D-sedoheptulose 7-phosphate isomerase